MNALLRFTCGLVICACVGAALAQTGTYGQGTDPKAPKEQKDPTTPSQKLKDALNASKPPLPGTVAYKSAPILRGRVIAKGQTPVALLEIDGKIQAVAKGSSWAGGAYRVTEINSTEVIIENVSLKELTVLR